jgi:hypothetical protein
LGLLAVGGSGEKSLTFRNEGSVSCGWSLQQLETGNPNGRRQSALSVANHSVDSQTETDAFKIER